MTRSRRHGRVLVDRSQNDPGKSIVAPYSLLGRVAVLGDLFADVLTG